MMSDEEEIDGKFKVHRHDWRSNDCNDFMEELDARASASNSKPRPRISRYYGTPRRAQPPTNTPEWMLEVSNTDDSRVLAPNSPDCLANSD